MAALLKTARIVGNLSVSLATWAHIFSPQEEEKKQKRGQLMALISLKGLTVDSQEEAAALGKEALTRLNEEYFGDLEKPPFDALSQAVEKVAIEVNDKQEVDLVAAALVGDILYLSASNRGQAFLRRGQTTGLILSGRGSSSGFVQAGDLFCLGTGDFFDYVSKDSLDKALASGNPLSTVEVLAPLVHTLPQAGDESKTGGMGLIVAQLPQSAVEDSVALPAEPEFFQQDVSRQTVLEKLDPVKERVAGWWDKLPIPFLKTINKTEKHIRLRWGLALGLAVLVVLVAMLGKQQNQQTGDLARVNELLAQAEEKRAAGQGLADLNPLKAKELLLEAQELFSQAENLSGEDKSALTAFKKELESALGSVLKGFEVEGQFFYDLSLIKPQASASELKLIDNQLIILDRDRQAVYQLELDNNRTETLAGGDFINQESLLGVDGSQSPWLFGDGRVYKGNSKAADFEDSWRQIKAVAYFNGFFYLVDGQADEIWKAPITTTSLDTSQAWLNDEIDLSAVNKMMIDGSIWLLFDDNRIVKLTRGAADAFKPAGLNEPLGKVVDFYTDEESENLYLLDSAKAKVVVLAKDGRFVKEYRWQGLDQANLIVVQEDNKRLLVASNGKIYSLELK